MLRLLEVAPQHRVLEVGAGSGYNAALLGLLAKQVVSLECRRELVEMASQNIRLSLIHI